MKSETVKSGFGEGRHYKSCESWQGKPCTCHKLNPTIPNPHAVALGRLGGRAGRGPSKARTTEQARAAVAVRWNRKRLEYLRQELRAERISYGELAELQGLIPFIDPSDVELLEAAGVPEKH